MHEGNARTKSQLIPITVMVLSLIVAIAFSVLLLIVLVWSYTPVLMWFNNYMSSPAQGPPASWATQLAIAQQAARSMDESAVLWEVTAYPTTFRSDHWNYATDSLEVQFTFLKPSGDQIVVTFEDTSPTSTLKTKLNAYPDAKAGFHPVMTPQMLEGSLKSVRLGPREAGDLTWSYAAAYAKQLGTTVSPVIGLSLGGEPAEWDIQYIASSRPMLYLGYDMFFVVDAQTGSIIKSTYTSRSLGPGAP